MSAQELAAALDISIPTLHRLLKESSGQVLGAGKARRARYALRRPLRGDYAELPLYAVDAVGRAEQVAALAPVFPQGSSMDLAATGWPVPEESRDGWWDGLPYPLYDMRPQGYMGRQFARAEHRQLGVSNNPDEWGDDDILFVLSRAGYDTSGNLILGDSAYERWQESKVASREPLPEADVGEAYRLLAEQAVASGVAGSSAAGEFPKFTAARDLDGSATPHVIVKFSGADNAPAVRRWADLLVCEHLALECASVLPGLQSAKSRVVTHAGRTFLEVERFDRHGAFGRSALCSLATLNPAVIGADARDWGKLAARFVEAGLLAGEDGESIEYLWWFGRLIGNTDMHAGNLSFRPQGRLKLAPTYDMLPMMYAPLPGGEVPQRPFAPPLPLPPQREVWMRACRAALAFWERTAADTRISADFRATCEANGQRLEELARHV